MAITFLTNGGTPFLSLAQIGEDGATLSENTPDLLVNESHSWQAEVTENPVEVGSSVSDHKYVRPKEYSVTVEYSDSPVSLVEAGNKTDRITTAVEFFETLLAKNITTNISTKMKDYTSLQCTGIQLSRGIGSGASQQITASFKEFRTVNTETITIEEAAPIEPTAAASSTKLSKNGKQTKTEASPSTAAQKSAPGGSVLSRLTGVGL